MKTITCKMLNNGKGGCDAEMHASTYEEIMGLGMKHLEMAHPEQAAKIKATPKDDPSMKEWDVEFRKTWEATPNV